MRMMKKWCMKLKVRISETTSSPAFKKLLESRSIKSVFIWLLILLGTVTGMVMQLIYITSLYKDTPINTEVTQVSATLKDFPSVTICKTFLVLSKYEFEKYATIPLPGYNNHTLNDFTEVMYSYVNTIFYTLHQDKYMANLEAVRRTEWRKIFYALPISIAMQLQNLLIHCEFNGMRCNFADFRVYDDPNYYNCFTFDVATFTNNYSLVTSKQNVALRIMMDMYSGVGSRDQSVRSMAADDMFQMEIHPQNSKPSMMGTVLIDSPSRIIQVDVKKSEINKMTLDRRPCFQNVIGQQYGYETLAPLTNFSDPFFYNKQFKSKYLKFTRNDCLNDELQKLMMTSCGCFSPIVPVSKYVIDFAISVNFTMVWCTENPIMTQYSNLNNFYNNFTITNSTVKYYYYYITKDGAVRRFEDDMRGTKPVERIMCLAANSNNANNLKIVNLRCQTFCFQEIYSLESRAYMWTNIDPSGNIFQTYLDKKAKAIELDLINNYNTIGNFTLSPSFTNKPSTTFSYIEINFDLAGKSIVSETETFPMINLCSNIGSILGVWIGASILVIAEFIVVCNEIVLTCQQKEEHFDVENDTKKASKKKIDKMILLLYNSSFQGLNHLVASRNLVYRLFWTVILCVAFVGLYIHTQSLVSLFLSNSISIEINYDMDRGEFPTITFCPSTIISHQLMKNTLLNYGNLRFNWNHLSRWSLSSLINNGISPAWRYLYKWQMKALNISEEPSLLNEMMEASIKHSLLRFLIDLKFSNVTRLLSYNFFFVCDFSYNNCTFDDYHIQYHPVYKMCFNYLHSNTSQRLGYPEHLSLLTLSNDVYDDVKMNTSSAFSFRGGLFEVHPFGTMSTMMYGHPFSYRSRLLVSITKSINLIQNSTLHRCVEDNLNITLIEEDITFSGTNHEAQYKYSPELCQQLKIQDEMIARCQCLSHMLPISKEQQGRFQQPRRCGELPVTFLRDDIYFGTRNGMVYVYLLFDYRVIELEEYVHSLSGGTSFLAQFNCQSATLMNQTIKTNAIKVCNYPCSKITYDLTINENKYPYFYQRNSFVTLNNNYVNLLNNINVKNKTLLAYYIQDNYQTVDMNNYLSGFYFYFKSTDTYSVVQVNGYSLINMLSDLGGVFGLWFGMSVTTFFEILELLVYLPIFR